MDNGHGVEVVVEVPGPGPVPGKRWTLGHVALESLPRVPALVSGCGVEGIANPQVTGRLVLPDDARMVRIDDSPVAAIYLLTVTEESARPQPAAGDTISVLTRNR